jgi:hypothetical protein
LEFEMKHALTGALVALILCLAARPACAQLNGNNIRGDFGVGSGTQAPPGTYAGLLFINYDTGTIKNRDGVDINTSGKVGIDAFAPLVSWVGPKKVLGGHYGFTVVLPPAQNNSIAAPVIGLNSASGYGVGDMYLQPLNLGWNTPRADYIVGVAFYLPTGRYTDGASDNIGLGMTAFELSAGTTVYADKAKTVRASAAAFWETHTQKKDSDTRVGDELTIEGGLGKSFLKGAASVGVAYVAQWKLTADDFGSRIPPRIGEFSKNRVFGLGPDVTLPIATKKKLIAFLNVRAVWEVGAHSTTEGRMLIIGATFPLPSLTITP